jgi:hypothetical protein
MLDVDIAEPIPVDDWGGATLVLLFHQQRHELLNASDVNVTTIVARHYHLFVGAF